MDDDLLQEPGLIILFGSGETSPSGRKIFDTVFQSLPPRPRLALLETPAGFEVNSTYVIQKIANFFTHKLQNFSPHVEIIPARKRGTPFSPDDPQIVAPLLEADLIFMGPGSPSYAVRQLRDSLAWHYLVTCHRHGTPLALASAATVAISSYSLPVYEIYKVGEDLHWNPGLDFFKSYGLRLVFIPHWNNQEGGTELDTSRCFMGQQRFAQLMDMLPNDVVIIGMDEKTALILDPSMRKCHVSGLGKITMIHTGHSHVSLATDGVSLDFNRSDGYLAKLIEQRHGHVHQYKAGWDFDMSEIGDFHPFHPEQNFTPDILDPVRQLKKRSKQLESHTIPDDVLELIRARDEARKNGDWIVADGFRNQIKSLGWEIMDTPSGTVPRKI